MSKPLTLASSDSEDSTDALIQSAMVKQAGTKFELIGPASKDGSSACTAWLVRSEHGDLAVFKPENGEAYEVDHSDDTIATKDVKRKPIRNGIVYGETSIKEVAAYLLDHNRWAGVPLTVDMMLWLKGEQQQQVSQHSSHVIPSPLRRSSHLPSLHEPSPSSVQLTLASQESSVNQHVSTRDTIPTYGSLQMFVENEGSAEDMGSGTFDVDEDIRLLNLDRHLGNMLVQRDPHSKRFHLIPIDHGFILPSYRDLSDIRLEWSNWRQCHQPFSSDTLAYIQALEPIQDAVILKSLGVRDEAVIAMMFSTLLLKECAAQGCTLYDIAHMVQRSSSPYDHAENVPKMHKTVLEHVVDRVCSKSDLLSISMHNTSPAVQSSTPEKLQSESSLTLEQTNVMWATQQKQQVLLRVTSASALEVADLLAQTRHIINEEIERFRKARI